MLHSHIYRQSWWQGTICKWQYLYSVEDFPLILIETGPTVWEYQKGCRWKEADLRQAGDSTAELKGVLNVQVWNVFNPWGQELRSHHSLLQATALLPFCGSFRGCGVAQGARTTELRGVWGRETRCFNMQLQAASHNLSGRRVEDRSHSVPLPPS